MTIAIDALDDGGYVLASGTTTQTHINTGGQTIIAVTLGVGGAAVTFALPIVDQPRSIPARGAARAGARRANPSTTGAGSCATASPPRTRSRRGCR